jgi:hypothetical protein
MPGSDADAGDLPDACRTYVALYIDCMHRLSPRVPAVVEGRVAGVRAALARITDPEELRRTCVNGASQLRTSCQ